MARQKWSWTPLQLGRAKNVTDIVNNLKEYHPLTLRQIFYQLVSSVKIKNTKSQYQMLSRLIKWMRIDEMLPWNVLEDRTRTITEKKGFSSAEDFINQELYYFLKGYSRCLVQSQDKHVEVWCEKDALLNLFYQTVYPYCMRAVICKGYQSITFIADFYKRATKAISLGKTPVVLYFGDLDPSGVDTLNATIETLENEMDLVGVEYKRIGLNPEQIETYSLPVDPTAVKLTDPRYKKYVKKYGNKAVELDALHPKDLQDLIKIAIENEIDIDKLKEEKEKEKFDFAEINEIRRKVENILV